MEEQKPQELVTQSAQEENQPPPAPAKDVVKEGAKAEVSAFAIARMMGVATTSELRVLEGKIDLVSSRVSTLGAKLDRILSLFTQMPTGSDLERIDVQIGGIKSLVRDVVTIVSGGKAEAAPASTRKIATQIITAESEEPAKGGVDNSGQ